MLIHQPGVARADQRPAVLHIQLQQVRLPARHQVQRRREHQLVFGQILRRPREIHRDVAMMQSVVKKLHVFAQVEMLVRLHRLLHRPVIVMAVKDADIRHHFRALERRGQQLDFVAQSG